MKSVSCFIIPAHDLSLCFFNDYDQSIVDHNSAVALFGKIFGWLTWYERPDLKF